MGSYVASDVTSTGTFAEVMGVQPSIAKGETARKRRKRVALPKPLVQRAMQDLDGTTAAQAKNMSDEERELVLLKRKLRNRESARRSNAKRQVEANALQDHLDRAVQLLEHDLDTLEQLCHGGLPARTQG